LAIAFWLYADDPDGQAIAAFHRVRDEIKQQLSNLIDALL
jgi:hypothetical protein